MPDPMTPVQRAAAGQVLREALEARELLVVSLCGAHAYGFASADSDVDLKGVWVAPARRLLGFAGVPGAVDRQEWVGEVEVDFTVNELGQAALGVLKGNGNMIERIMDGAPLHAGEGLDELRALTRKSLSKRVYKHYRGFATGQRKAVDPKAVSAKKLLYVLRTTTTGAHLLESGEVIPDLSALWERYELPEVPELIGLKREAEKGVLPSEVWTMARVEALMTRAFSRLDRALEASKLPEHPSEDDQAAMERWLIERRLASLS
ncbi:nucleotidyltransferase domain-containing protein [Pseudenhygromyxa sp. WMMC2535]|uniref:nucleotidyltransferase domain-containing protein n=1 Tax=Pseudenhygromyxa sp. WMMC2535 TaxID=2712867 RepID=UPI00155204AC|nr:nucleotidyltransferase domain-containing protein [Pseudenhygromyxa sp. WMMC2535]NVB37908.1 nucleotidyltransferase domain-containing protein [Pseudenhygromyxa sp. WMMC2535]